jgi:NDP-sugar pyrophosphorylase family protein
MDLANWPVAILAGGLATRLRPATDKTPKALLSVAGEPFLVHQLRLLHSEGFRNIVICVGYLGETVQAKIGDGNTLGLHIDYSFDGPTLLGTGGALKLFQNSVKNFWSFMETHTCRSITELLYVPLLRAGSRL